jgi:type IV pilus assembly protein PilB
LLSVDTRTDFEQATDPESPVVRLVNLIIQEAINLRADRILFYPDLDALAVRYRIDSEWVERDRIPLRLMRAVTTRLALMALIVPIEWVFANPSCETPFHGALSLLVHGVNFLVRATIQPSPDGPTTQLDLAREPAVLA